MEEWEKILENYEIHRDSKTLNTIIRCAKSALDEDLAPFESDWVFSKLLKKPVNLLEAIAEHRMTDEYNKSIVDALKLLADAIDKYNNFEQYYEEVSELCLLQYPAVPRQHALCCLSRMARRAPCAARGLREHLTALQQGVGRAPRAVLIGTICEHQPHVVADDVNNIWRVFLNLLDYNKYSATVIKAVLQGILGLFKHFGDDLPTMELINFYDKLVTLLEINSCQEVCFAILTHHARLFFTCVTRDASTRALLWRLQAWEALQAVYAVCDAAVLQEVKTYLSFPHHKARCVARRLLGEAGGDDQELEDALRSGGGDEELGDKISWSIQTNTQSNHRLLQAAMLFYDNFPKNTQTDILRALLDTQTHVLSAAITFLIAEISRNQKRTIWQDILTCDTEKLKIVYDNINKYINTIVEGVAEGREGPPLSSLLPLLVSLPPRVRVQCVRVRALRHDGDVTTLLAAFCDHRNVPIEDCAEDEVKIKCSLVVLNGTNEPAYPARVSLAALQTIFSTKTMEATTLSRAVSALEELLTTHTVQDDVLTDIIHNLEKIRKRTDKTKKADRILCRDICKFVGKYKRTEYSDNDLNSLIVNLKNTLTIQIPHETGTLKINLDGVLYSALQLEDEDALNVLMSVICAHLSRGGVESLQRVLVRVCVCVSHTSLHAHIAPALRVCDASCAHLLLQYIFKEKSSESRKILLEGLEILIRKDTEEHVLENIVEKMIYIEDQKNSPSYLHVLDTMNSLLKDYNSVCLKLLPDFVIKVLKTPKSERILTNTYNLFTNKMYIYEDLILNNFIKEIIQILNIERNITKNNITLDFVKDLLNKTNKNIKDFIGHAEDLKLFVSMKRCFDFDSTLNMVAVKQVGEKLFENFYDLESVLMFLEIFSDILLETEYEKTISLLSQIIVNLTPQEIRDNSKGFIQCIKSLKNHLQVLPVEATNCIEEYIKKINIHQLSESVEKSGFNADNQLTIHAIRTMIEAMDGSTLSGFDNFIVSWKDMFHKLYNSGYVKICLESKIEALSDLTFVALKFMNEDEIKCVILQGPDDFGISFTASLMSVFLPHLSASLLTHCSTLLHHVITHTRRGDVTPLVDQIWPHYERVTTFRQKQLFLLDYLPHSPDNSEPLRWVMTTLKSNTNVENKLMILDVLPKGDVYGPLPLLLLPLIPSRLSELKGATSDCFRAILDALATNTHTSVLEAVATLADNDPTAGWWDSALSWCMSSVSRGGEEGLRLVWGACGHRGRGAFERLMVPLLRHSSSSVIESFVSSIVEDLLCSLRRTPRGGSCSRGVQRQMIDHIRAFNILEIVFQRVPRDHIESPRSQLYRHMSVEAPFHLVTVVCKLCVTLRALEPPQEDGGMHSVFLSANYRCLSAALLCRSPRHHVYRTVLQPAVWRPLLTHQEPLTLTTLQRQSVTRQAARASSVRTRVFLRTLSENPLAYDMLEEEEEITIEEFKLPDTPLNRHSCMPAVTALLNEVGGGEGGEEVIREGVLQALEGEPPLAMYIAQAVCNAREALKGHSGWLTPALCALLEGRVNDLHLHMLDTIIYWRAELTETENLKKAIENLISKIIVHGRTDNLYRMLLDKLTKLLDIYGNIVNISWSCFENYFKDPKSKSFEICLKVLNRINIYIPELLPALSALMERRVTFLWSAYGKALTATQERGGGEGELRRYRSVLESLRASDSAEYMKALYYVQREHPPAADYKHYRSIADLVPKIPRRERPRCLSILSSYVRRCGDAHDALETIDLPTEMDTVQGLELARVSLPLMSPSLRARVVECALAGVGRGRGGLAEAAYQVILTDFELNAHQESSIKRRTLTPHPHIYTAVGVARGLEGAREGVKGLSTDLGVRFCECFILCVVVPLRHNLNANMSAFLELFFQDIRQQEIFKNAKLSEEEFEVRSPSNTRTLSGIQQGTDTIPEVDIQMSIEDVLNSIIKFSRRDSEARTSIIIQLIRALRDTRPGFDLQHTVETDVYSCLTHAAAPQGLLQLAREIHAGDTRIDEVEHLVHRMRNSEGEGASRALYEELLLRKEKEFALGGNYVQEEDMPEVSETFSMKDLISTFGKLSNWDNITRHEQTHRALPPLWTDRHTFTSNVDEYDFKDSPLWLRAMVSKYKEEDIHIYKIFKDLDKWPRNYFDIAAVLESQDSDVSLNTQTYIHPSDCMAQWAARIMVGSLYSGNSHLPSRSLAWCERGNEIALYEQVVACCRSGGGGIESEASKLVNFVYQEVLALRGMALERKDSESLRNLLVRAESYNPLKTESNFVDMLGVNELTLLLRQDINCLERVHVDSVVSYIKQNVTCSFKTESISTICVLGMTLYDKIYSESTDAQEQSSLLVCMCELVGLHGGVFPARSPLLCEVLLHALDAYRGHTLGEHAGSAILNTLRPHVGDLDECAIDRLKSKEHLFPEHEMLLELHRDDLDLHKYKQCLSLLGDPHHLLQHYCDQLARHLEGHDESQYKETMLKMNRQVFENPYSGPDYRVLLKYVAKFNDIQDFAKDKQVIKKVLKNIQSELSSKRNTLSLSDLCPTLSRERDSESLNRLLGLKRGLRVVKFEEKMCVFSAALSRPVLLSFLSSDGVTRRRIVKREAGGGHAAVMRGRRAVRGVGGAAGGYAVNTLTDECVLIEYLEHHTPLRGLVSSVCHIDVPVRPSVDLVLSPGESLLQHQARCRALPPGTLRSAIEARSATFQDFLCKKKNFQESVCWMTILNFLFGVSDRHLENILYCEESGAACDVDCGDLSAGEIPPARITRNILAVCDVTALEGSLQRKLSKIREHRGIILPSIKMAFKNTDRKYRDKVPFIQGKMQGSLLPHQVFREILVDSPLQHHDRYIQLLDQVFGTDTKTEYSVEEQISSLLVQCTDPRILSVTRAGWEPWI